MATLVFDIETSAVSLDSFDESSQEYLMRPANNLPTEAEQEAKREELTRMMSLWPFTAQVVCIAMINAETLRGQVIFIADDFESNTRDVTGVDFMPVMDEVELLNQFWAVAGHYDKVVTDRKSTRLNSSHKPISYAVFCLKKKNHRPPPSPPLLPYTVHDIDHFPI